MWHSFVLVLSCILIASSASAEPFITNVTELIGLSDAEMATGRRFQLQGTVLTSFPHLLKTADGTILLRGDIQRAHVSPGDVIFVRGETLTDVIRHYYVTVTRKLSSVAAPEPEDIDPALLAEGRADMRYAAVRGHVDDIFTDEIDSRFVFLVLNCGGIRILVSIQSNALPPDAMNRLNGADVEAYGSMMSAAHEPSSRRYVGRTFRTWANRPVRIIRPAAADPAAIPELPPEIGSSAQDIAKLGRRRISGTVLAAWGKSSFLLNGPSDRIHRIELAAGQACPVPGDRVAAAGTVETDLFNVNLSHAICRTYGKAAEALPGPNDLADPAPMLSDGKGNRQFNPKFCGKAVCLRGIVRKPVEPQGATRFELNCGKHIVPVVIGDNASQSGIPAVGSKVDVTGCCVMDVDNWLPTKPFPRIRDIFIVTRTPDDIVVISKPPWWTPARFTAALLAALVALVGILIWNGMLRRLAEKRGKELSDEQVAHAKSEFRTVERTRLAIELHDTLSQDLAAVACQIAATTSQFHTRPDEAMKNLVTSEKMLLSCRTELKRCLWDLRSDTLEDADLTHAVRRTLAALAKDVRMTVRFNVPRDCLTDTSAHALLCIVRELVSNAIVHGKATAIKIAGSLDGGRILFSVIDDGLGFDPHSRPGPETGHFGLAGIETRVKRLHGKLTVRSAPGKGTRAAVVLSIAEPEVQ